LSGARPVSASQRPKRLRAATVLDTLEAAISLPARWRR